MRVTFLMPQYGWHASGGFRVVYTYAGLLAERGHDVSVVHPRQLPRGGWQRPRGILQHARRVATRARDLLFRPRLAWAGIDLRVRLLYAPEITDSWVPDADVVIATWWSTAEAAIALSSRKGRRFHLIQGYEVWNGAEERVHAAWRAPLHKIIIARWLLDKALELGVDRSDTALIPNAIDHTIFRIIKPIESRGPRVAMLYSPESYKGGTLGLEILHRARERIPGLTAVLFGAGRAPRPLPDWVRYVRAATPHHLAEHVYSTSSVYLCPSLSEGWHLPPAEAMACGCALVSSDIGGVADYATHGDTALLYTPGDVAAGADRLVELLANDGLRTTLARRGRDRIVQFSWDRSADRLCTVIEQQVATG